MNIPKPLFHLRSVICKMSRCKMSDYEGFQEILKESKSIVALTGAGISAESGLGTFRGPSGIWRTHRATDLATMSAFLANPSRVWEFYHWRRESAFAAKPNKAHLALSEFEKRCSDDNKKFALITQNVDNLHQRAGSSDVIEMHGSVAAVKCTKCTHVVKNYDSPICKALQQRGNPETPEGSQPDIPVEDLPKCAKCKALARPGVVWFGENLDYEVLQRCRQLIENCDLFLVIGTSSVVYPAASFARFVAERGKPVAEFNIELEPASDEFAFHFSGKCSETLPKALRIE